MLSPVTKSILVFFAASLAAQAAATCDRACLKGFIDGYLDALAKHDPSGLAVAPNVKFTENSGTLKLGQGLWKTAGATTYRLYLLDPASGGAALQSVIKENGSLTSFFLRLKIADKKITEVETIVTRENESNVFAPEKLTAPDPLWAQVVPAAERATREQLIAAANSYFDAIETQGGNYKPAPFAADCNRFENGGQTTNVPGPNGRPPMGCAAQFDAKIFTWIPEVNDRRYPVVDPEHGVVLGIVMFGEPGGQPIPGSDKTRAREATLLAEAFNVTGGQIHRINAVMINRPYHSPSGWNAVLSGSRHAIGFYCSRFGCCWRSWKFFTNASIAVRSSSSSLPSPFLSNILNTCVNLPTASGDSISYGKSCSV